MPLLSPEDPSRATRRTPTRGAAFVPDQSRAERRTSFDVADFPMPTGREEEWRFTPVDRLAASADRRADRQGAALRHRRRRPAEGVVVGDARRWRQAPRGTALVPADRAVGRSPARTPRRAARAHPRRGRAHRAGAGPRAPAPAGAQQRPRRRRGRPAQPRRRRARPRRARGEHAGNVEVRRRRRRRPDRRDRAALGRRRPPPGPARRAGRPRRDVQAHRRDPRRRHRAGQRPTCATPAPAATPTLLGVYFADAGQHLEHRSFVDHDAPQLQEPRHLQGRAAGRLGAHRLGRRRADPRRGRRHRDLRAEPQPGPHRRARAPTRCPTWRSRPARSSEPGTRLPPGVSTTSSCSTCRPAASPRTRPAAWSCAASSSTSSARSRCPRAARPPQRGHRRRAGCCPACRRRRRHAPGGHRVTAQPVPEPTRSSTASSTCARSTTSPRGRPPQADVDGTVVAMVRDAEGGYHAIDDQCTHANVSLAEGEVDGCTLECWLHGSRFDLRTGEPTGPPATIPVAVYDVRVDGDDVYVALTPPPEPRRPADTEGAETHDHPRDPRPARHRWTPMARRPRRSCAAST